MKLVPETEVQMIERCSGHGGAWGVRKGNFETALKIGLPHIGLIYESERLTASSLFLSGAYLEAAQRYHSLAEREDLGIERGERETLYKWGRRALFFAENMTQPEPELDVLNPDH